MDTETIREIITNLFTHKDPEEKPRTFIFRFSPTKAIQYPVPPSVGVGDKLWDDGWAVSLRTIKVLKIRYLYWEIQKDIVDGTYVGYDMN